MSSMADPSHQRLTKPSYQVQKMFSEAVTGWVAIQPCSGALTKQQPGHFQAASRTQKTLDHAQAPLRGTGADTSSKTPTKTYFVGDSSAAADWTYVKVGENGWASYQRPVGRSGRGDVSRDYCLCVRAQKWAMPESNEEATAHVNLMR